jgi:hypothetical protein
MMLISKKKEREKEGEKDIHQHLAENKRVLTFELM